jgi:hypothetical protein
LNIHIVIIGADNKNFHVRVSAAKMANSGDGIEVGHGDINEQAVGLFLSQGGL